MKLQNAAVGAQGACTAWENYALTVLNDHTLQSPKYRLSRHWRQFLAFCCLCLCTTCGALCQNYDTLGVSGVGYQIVVPQVTLDQGETVTVDVITNEVLQAHEVDLYLELGPDALFPSEPEVSFGNSWFFTGAATSTIGTNAITRRITVDGASTDPQSGNGTLFQITLESDKDGTEAGDLVAGGGCLVVVDNLGFNPVLSAARAVENPRLYPNPCHDRLKVDWQGTQPSVLQVYDQEGNLVMEQRLGQSLPAEYSVGHLPRGVYLIVVEFDTHRWVEKLLLI